MKKRKKMERGRVKMEVKRRTMMRKEKFVRKKRWKEKVIRKMMTTVM